MDCKTARAVWNHPNGMIAGLQETLPEVYGYLREQARRFVHNAPDAYNDLIQEQVAGGGYRVEHSTGETPLSRSVHDVLGDMAACHEIGQHFSKMFGQNIAFGNLCCGGCITNGGDLPPEQVLRVQMATVNTDPI